MSPPQSHEMTFPFLSSSAFGTRRCTGHAVGWIRRSPSPEMAGHELTSVQTAGHTGIVRSQLVCDLAEACWQAGAISLRWSEAHVSSPRPSTPASSRTTRSSPAGNCCRCAACRRSGTRDPRLRVHSDILRSTETQADTVTVATSRWHKTEGCNAQHTARMMTRRARAAEAEKHSEGAAPAQCRCSTRA